MIIFFYSPTIAICTERYLRQLQSGNYPSIVSSAFFEGGYLISTSNLPLKKNHDIEYKPFTSCIVHRYMLKLPFSRHGSSLPLHSLGSADRTDTATKQYRYSSRKELRRRYEGTDFSMIPAKQKAISYNYLHLGGLSSQARRAGVSPTHQPLTDSNIARRMRLCQGHESLLARLPLLVLSSYSSRDIFIIAPELEGTLRTSE